MKASAAVIKKIVISAVAVVVVLAAMLWLSGSFPFRRDVIPADKVVPLEARPIAAQTAPVAVEELIVPFEAQLVGTVQAEVRTTIAARLVANIVEMNVRAGDTVKQGQVVVVLDDSDLQTRVRQAQQGLKAAEAAQRSAQVEVDRLVPMVRQQAATQSELDQWKAKLDAAIADVARAQQAVKETEVLLSYTQIRSSIAGIVVDRQAEPGDQASPGRTLLTVYDPARFRLEASVREAYLPYLQTLKKNKAAIPIRIEALDQIRSGVGANMEIVPAADPASRSFLVKVPLEKSDDLYPGMFGRLVVKLDPRPRLVIPAAAVSRVGQLTLVDVLVDDRPQRRAVRLGQPIDPGRVEVLAGVQRGEKVLAPK